MTASAPSLAKGRPLWVIGLVAVAMLSCACGYSLAGRGSFLPEYIQTVGIPTFGNLTHFNQVEQTLTEKVRSEFIGRGKYRVMPQTTGVDAVLTGQITSISITPASFTQEQQASRYVFTMTAKIEFKDLKTNKVLWENPSMVFREEYEAASGRTPVVDQAAFFGQESNAVQRITADFARSVVSAILEAF